MKKCTSRTSRFCLIFCLILHQWVADAMNLDILAAFHTNSRGLLRIWRSWGLIPSRNRKQGAARVGPGVGKIFKIMKIGKSWKMGWEWSGELQTGPKWPAQLSERFKQLLDKDSLKKTMTNLFFMILYLFGISCWGHSPNSACTMGFWLVEGWWS